MNPLKSRKYIIGAVIIFIFLVFIIKLFVIQVVKSEFKDSADNNSMRYVTQYPARGLIYDRNNKILVYNEAAYDLMIIPRQTKEFDTLELVSLLGIRYEDVINKISKAKKYSYYKPSIFVKQISSKDYALLQEKLYKYKGFYVQIRTLRKYPKKIASHIFGYVGEVNKKTVDENTYYKSGDYIGISGLEKSYEKELRGKKGVKIFLVDNHNRIKGNYADEKKDTLPVIGKNLITTLDAELQGYGERLLNNKIGSIVAIEPKTGEILAMISSPSYDPNLLVGRIRTKNYKILVADTLKPLFNRAIMSRYSPGSIFKIVNGLVGLQMGVINEQTGFPCNKSLVMCHNHPTASNLKKAIQFSCNPYFYNVYRKIIQQGIKKSIYKDSEIGLREWRKYVLSFGFGEALNIDIPGVKGGLIPYVEFYNKWYGEHRWAFSTIYSNGIGQGEVEAIPIQMANLAAIIANKGFYYIPHFVKSVGDKKEMRKEYKHYHYTKVNKKHYDVVSEAMYAVVNEPGGTARRARIKNIEICGKTGTVQNVHGEDHSGFIAFAPRENPKIAIAVYVENAGFGGTWAAPIASLMIEKYLTDTISNKYKEDRILNANFIEGE